MSETIEALILKYEGWATDIVTTTASLIFLWSFFKVHEKTHSQYMILILCLIDLLFPLVHMARLIFSKPDSNTDAFFYTSVCIYRFSLYWSAAIAICSYIIIIGRKTFSTKKFTIISFFICLVLTTYCPLM